MLTPANAALWIVGYQPIQVSSVLSMDRALLIENIVRVTKIAQAYGLPIVVSTINVKTGRSKPLISQLQDVLPRVEPLDRTSINAWEDKEFLSSVKATGRKKLIISALWTEVCLPFHHAIDGQQRSSNCGRFSIGSGVSLRAIVPSGMDVLVTHGDKMAQVIHSSIHP